MQRTRRAATLLAALALAACSDHRDLVAPQSAPIAPAPRSSAITTSNGDGGVTATVDGPDNVAPGAVANYTVTLTAPTAPTVLSKPLDVVFVLDASGSEGSYNFNLEKQAVVSQVNAMQWGTNNRAGVVEFATTTVTDYTFTTNQTATAISATVSGLPYMAADTYTLNAMNAAEQIFENSPRADATRLIVLLTDGNPNPANTQNPCSTTLNAAAQLRAKLSSNSISTIILGVGADINAATLGCLYNYDPTRFIPVADFTGLANALHGMFDQLAGIQQVRYTAALPAGFTVGTITNPNAHVASGVLTWDAGVISGSTVQLTIPLTASASFCGSAPTLTQQSLAYLNSGASASLDLPDQSIASTVSCDVTGPVIAPTITGAHVGDWYSGNVTVHWDVTDPESPVTSQTGCADVTISTNTDAAGTTITCAATSGGGSSSQSVTIKRDATVPTVTGSAVGAQTNGWYTGSPTVSFAEAYGPSGAGTLSGCGPFTVTADGAFSYTCTATSAAGLSGTATVTGKRDASAPSVGASISGTEGSNGWYVSNVQLHWNVSDPQSGVASTVGCADLSLTQDGANVVSTCQATNGAGENGSAQVTLERDATKPVITVSGNQGSYTVDQQVAITCAASDATSGVASSTCPSVSGAAYTFNATNSYSAQATDNAGNTATTSFAFTINVTADGIIGLIDQFVHGTDANVLAVRVRDIADKLAKSSPALDSQLKNFQKELAKAQQDGQISAGNAAVLWHLVQLLH